MRHEPSRRDTDLKLIKIRQLSSSEAKGSFLLGFIGFFRTFAVALVSPYLGLALYKKGVPLPYVGAVYVLLAVFGALGQIFGGSFSDKYGRRHVMFASQMLSGLSLVAMGALYAYSGYAPFLLATFIQNFFGSSNMAAFNAYVGDLGRDQGELIKGYGLMRVGINIGWAVGPLLGGALIGFLGFSWAWAISGIIVLSSSFFFLLLRAAQRHFSSLSLEAVKDLRYLFWTSPFILIYAFVAQFGLTLTIYETVYRGVPVYLYGSVYLLNGMIVAIFQMPMARMLAKRNIIRWIEYALGLYMLGFFIFSFGGLMYALLGTLVLTFGENILMPLAMTLANMLAKEEKRGTYLGLFGVLSSSSRSLGSLYGSLVLSDFRRGLEVWGLADVLGAASLAYFSLVSRSYFKPRASST